MIASQTVEGQSAETMRGLKRGTAGVRLCGHTGAGVLLRTPVEKPPFDRIFV